MPIEDFETRFKKLYPSTSSFVQGFVLMWIDALMLVISLFSGFLIINCVNSHWVSMSTFINYLIYIPAILFVFYLLNLYPGIMISPVEEVKKFCVISFCCFMGIALIIAVEQYNRWPVSAALAVAFPFATILLPIGREIAKRIFARYYWWGVPVVIYSKNTQATVIIERLLDNPTLGYRPSIIITDYEDHPDSFRNIPVYTSSDKIFEIIKKLNIKVAIICGYEQEIDRIMSYYRYTITVPKNQLVSNTFSNMLDFGGIMGFSMTHNLTKNWNLLLKRIIDLLLILISLPIVLPVVIIISIIILITDPGPVFYCHMRVGKNGKPLKTWKFRSMCLNSEERLKEILANDPVRAQEWEKDRKFKDDPRVTKFGAFLRKTSLDELPQLWNIFLGQMSFIGPRPVTQPELERYGKYADYVLSVKPGLSGMWQISGRSDTGYEERVTLDTYYIQNWSIWLDIWIIIKTIWVVLKGDGAY